MIKINDVFKRSELLQEEALNVLERNKVVAPLIHLIQSYIHRAYLETYDMCLTDELEHWRKTMEEVYGPRDAIIEKTKGEKDV